MRGDADAAGRDGDAAAVQGLQRLDESFALFPEQTVLGDAKAPSLDGGDRVEAESA